MRMRKISWRMSSCFYPSWKPSQMLLVKLNVFSLCLVAELSVALTNIRPVFPFTVTYPHYTTHAQPRGEDILIFYKYRSVSVNLFAIHTYQWYLHIAMQI